MMMYRKFTVTKTLQLIIFLIQVFIPSRDCRTKESSMWHYHANLSLLLTKPVLAGEVFP